MNTKNNKKYMRNLILKMIFTNFNLIIASVIFLKFLNSIYYLYLFYPLDCLTGKFACKLKKKILIS